jgi:putative DNA primase/helicase
MKYMKESSNQLFQFAKPQPAAEPVVLSRLLDEIKSTIQAHVVIPEQAATALAVWVVHTYVYKERDAVAYVAIESPEKRCGKTTLLSVLAGLACRSLVASNITVGALFRAIDEYGPTLLIDEADT